MALLHNSITKLLPVLLIFCSLGFSQKSPDITAPAALKPGVVIEEVKRNWGGDRAGLQPEDTLVEWSRGDEKGEIESPFSLVELENEQSRGNITIIGFRDNETKTWELRQIAWGIKSRPNLSNTFLTLYREGQRLAEIGRHAEAVQRWRQAASMAEQSPTASWWLSSWFMLHSAEILAVAQKWREVDDTGEEAIQKLPPNSLNAATCLKIFGSLARERGDLDKSEEFYGRALAIEQKVAADSLGIARILNNLGTMARIHNELNQAEEYHQRALLIQGRLAHNSLDFSESLTNLGAVARVRKDFNKAKTYYQQALVIQEKLAPESLNAAKTLYYYGDLAFAHEDLSKAAKYYKQALVLRESLSPGSLDTTNILFSLGVLADQRGDLDKAESYYQKALAIQNKTAPGSIYVARSLDSLGSLVGKRGDSAQAAAYYTQELAIEKKIRPDSDRVFHILMDLGNNAFLWGDSATAVSYFEDGLAIAERKAPNSQNVAFALMQLAMVAQERGDLDQAKQYENRIVTINQKLAPDGLYVNRSPVSVSLFPRGLVILEKQALRSLSEKKKLAPNSLLVADAWHHLGEIEWALGDLGKAESYHRRALTITKRLAPRTLKVARILDGLSRVALKRKNSKKANDYLRQALMIRQKLAPKSMEYVVNLTGLGQVARYDGDLADAERYFRQALAKEEKRAHRDSASLPWYLGDLGDVLAARNNFAEAELFYRQALAISRKCCSMTLENAKILAGLAGVLRRKRQPEAAAQLYEQASSILIYQLARRGGMDEARMEFRAANGGFQKDYVDLLLELHQPETAFQVLGRSRAQELLEMLARAGVDVRKSADPALLEKMSALQREVATQSNYRVKLLAQEHTEEQLIAVGKRIDELLVQYQEVENRVRSTSPGYADLTQPKPLTLQQVQQLLDVDTVLIEYSLNEKHSHVFLVSSNSITAYDLPKRAAIEFAAHRLYKTLTAWDRRGTNASQIRNDRHRNLDLSKESAALSWMILGPIVEQIQGKRLLIVGDGVLEYIPFAALPVPASPDKRKVVPCRKQVPLIAEHEIINLPSMSVLAELRQPMKKRPAASKAIAVLADPVFNRNDERVKPVKTPGNSYLGVPMHGAAPYSTFSGLSSGILNRSISDVRLRGGGREFYLPRLPFTRREARKILAVAPKRESMAALDFKASRAVMFSPELEQYRIVHIATHGLIDSKNPSFSGVVLSMVDERGKPQDGFLGLDDIYNLSLNADLVVLSACQTGLGKEVEGEGLVGMTQGFMYAGARSVLASLWNADDVATAELMSAFYMAMEQEKIRPAAALRKAQIQMWRRKRWNDPYYWAGFQLQGDWK